LFISAGKRASIERSIPKDHSRGALKMAQEVRMYTTEWCGHCRRLKRQLGEAGIDVVEVDVDVNAEHDKKILAATGGYRTVPTIEIGTRLLVNPSVAEVKTALGT
jgi:mycoredoxin